MTFERPRWPVGGSRMAALVRAHDWAATSLGPMDDWPRSLRAVVDLILGSPLAMVVLWGPDLTQIYNDAYRVVLAGKHPAGLGQPTRDCWPEVWDFNAPIYQAVMGGDARSFTAQELTILRRDTPEQAFFDLNYSPVRDGPDQARPEGSIAGVLVTVVESTARVRSEQRVRDSEARQAFLLQLSDALRPLADPSAVQAAAARLLSRHLGANQVHNGEVCADSGDKVCADSGDEVRVVVRQGYGDGLLPIVGAFRHRTTGWGGRLLATYRAGRTAVCRDVGADPAIGAEEAATIMGAGFRAYVAVPLVKDGVWVAVLAVHSIAPRDWTANEIALIEETAERTWNAKERSRAERELRGSRQRFRTLVTAGTYSIYRMSPDWRVMFQLDSESLANTAEPDADWVGKYILPEDRATVSAAIAQAISTKSLFELEHRVLLADGSTGWVVSRAVPLLGPDGEITEWFGAGRNVTDRRVAADAMRDNEERHRTDLEQQVRERTEELKASRDLLKATMDSSLDLIQVFEAVRGSDGAIVDFRWILNNHASERLYGDVIGHSLLTANPGVVKEGIFDTFKRVIETGRPDQAERRYAHGQSDGWLFQSVAKLGDGVATTTKEISDWKAAQAAVLLLQEQVAQARLRESEDRLRQFGEASQDVLWIRDAATLQWEYLTPAFESIYGLDRRSALSGDTMANWVGLILPEDRDQAVGSIGRVRNGEWVTFEYRIQRPVDGQVRWLRNTDFPIKDETGQVVRIGGVGHDVTTIKDAEKELAVAEQRQRVLLEGIPQLVWRSGDDGLWTWSSPQWQTYTGQTLEQSLGWGWIVAVHPDDQDATRLAWHAARSHGRLDVEYRVRRASDGAWHWHATRSVPVRAESWPDEPEGRILEWLGTTTDIEDLKRLQGQQQVMVAELQHRTRNLLGVVRNVARRSIPPSPDRDEYDARLAALGRVQGFLSRSPLYTVPLAELVEAELVATGDGASEKVVVGGPAVALPGEGVQAVALALHELATNAVKYGAFAQGKGQLSVTWQLEKDEGAGDGDARLVIDWRERDVTIPDRPPKRRGYGSVADHQGAAIPATGGNLAQVRG